MNSVCQHTLTRITLDRKGLQKKIAAGVPVLHAVRSKAGFQNIMYVGPHRAMRRQRVMQKHLLAPTIQFEKLLEGQSVPGFEGIRILDGARDPWGYDDTANYLKHALCQIEVDRQQAVTVKLDRDGEIRRGTLSDPWSPLRELCKNLLPHMRFHGIDATNRDQVKVLWQVHGSADLVDLDDLSSGEKSIIQMFYPLVERKIRARVKEIEAGPQQVDRPELCVLIDEPELHLHPNLQLKVLDYLRVLATGTRTQVVVATHSPTIVENASFEELFLLRSPELVNPEQNQLIQVASDEERLAFLRETFGSTTNLTALQPIVVVEGVGESDAAKVMPDRKLYRALHQGFDGVTLIPGGGKGECIALLRVLDTVVSHFSSRLRAVALLDRDVANHDAAGVELLPVSMVENFLLDADSIWEAIQSVLEKTEFTTVDDIAAALDRIADEQSEQEVARRTALGLGSSHFHPPSTSPQHIVLAAEAYTTNVGQRYSEIAIADSEALARQRVAELSDVNRRREEFDGKRFLKEFYGRYLHRTGLSKTVFTFEAARHARRRRSVLDFFESFFSRLTPAVPAESETPIEEVP